MKLRNLIFLLLHLAFPLLINAQTDTVFINEVVIKADKPTAFRMEGNRIIQIITKEQINNLPVRSLNELLEYTMNADVRKRGADEVQADISLRGGSVEQTLILLNGVRINDPQTGHHNLDIPVELSQVARIEILEGSGARQYGANAFCGVINIVTDQPGKNFLRLDLMGGMYGLYDGALSGGYATKSSTGFISLSNKKCSGYTRNTDYDVRFEDHLYEPHSIRSGFVPQNHP